MSYRLNDKGVQLSEQLEKLKYIFSYEIYEYLESILNLEVSALRQSDISSRKLDSLSELKLYKDIFYYNVCCRALNYIDLKSIKYDVESFEKSFFINYGNILNDISLFGVKQDDDNKVNISLAHYDEPTLTDVSNAYIEKIERLKKIILDKNTRFKSKNKSNFEYLYSRIKNYKLEDLKRIREREIEFVQKQNDFYDHFIKDSDLEYLADLSIMNDSSLLVDSKACKVLVKRQVKTPIFK